MYLVRSSCSVWSKGDECLKKKNQMARSAAINKKSVPELNVTRLRLRRTIPIPIPIPIPRKFITAEERKTKPEKPNIPEHQQEPGVKNKYYGETHHRIHSHAKLDNKTLSCPLEDSYRMPPGY